ncbi:MAG: extracellular solute-binding protein [Lachnospiraceae bacterium]|nr:extracellular solute-binding protein [Lachnospiraceae bacterium]MDD3659629.1 extracellular solute-binding protein [Lachnospiraceae bacterium]
MKKKLLSMLLAATMVISLTACGGSQSDTAGESDAPAETKTEETETEAVPTEEATGEAVTIRVFSNLPDRTTGQGFVEQTLFDSYMAENPNITIEVEALDDEAYKTKFKAYASGSDMPDLVNAWGQPSFLNEIIDAGLLAELNMDDYADYGFISGSLDGFSKEGKLYGLARNTDVMGFYYNKALFESNGWTIPTTYDELLTLAGKIQEAGLIPVSMDGSDKWPISIYVHDLMQKIDPSIKTEVQSSIANADFSNPVYTQAADLMVQAVDAGMFQNGFETTDYGTAKNLFTNAQSAMFYMGSWEMSMAADENIPAEVRDNIGVFMMPAVEGGKGTNTDIAAWNGGGYAVTANSAVKEEAVKLLNYMFKPENWSKLCWENGICMSAQNYSDYLTGSETPVQLEFTDIVSNATSVTGVTLNDLGTSEFKTISEDLSQELAIKSVSSEEFVKALEDACK